MENDVYMVVKRDETGRTYETRVIGKELAEHIDATFRFTSVQLLAVIRLTNHPKPTL